TAAQSGVRRAAGVALSPMLSTASKCTFIHNRLPSLPCQAGPRQMSIPRYSAGTPAVPVWLHPTAYTGTAGVPPAICIDRAESMPDWTPPRDWQSLRLRANGIELHAVAAGPADGQPVILLHGFPEFWYGWRRQIGPLAAAGLRVVALDQRGYNLSEKPAGI